MFTATDSWKRTHVATTPLWSSSVVRVDPLAVYSGSSATWALNSFKGSLGERMLNATVTAGVFEGAKPAWFGLTPHRIGPTGLDSVFVKVDAAGAPRGVMVADAKFGSARQALTSSGLQMSTGWVRPRLLATARDYAYAASAARRSGVVVGEIGGPDALSVPLPGGRVAMIGLAGDRVVCSERLDPRTLERQLRRMATALRTAARQGDYAQRLFRLDVKGGEFVLTMQRLDSAGNPVGRAHSMIRGTWKQLGERTRRLLKDCVRQTFADHVATDADADRLCRAVCRDPSLLRQLRLQPRSRWLIGVDRGMAYTAVGAAGGAVLFEILPALWRGERIDWARVVKSAALSAASAAASYWVSSQVQVRLASATMGRLLLGALPLRSVAGSAAVVGGVVAGVGVGVVTALGAYALGLADRRQAVIMGTASAAGAVAAAAVPVGAFAAAGAFGTAGTGTAISMLSGAAFKSAALAWMGGSVAAGSALLTGGTAVVVIAVPLGVHKLFAKLDEVERERLVLGRMELVDRQLSASS